MPIIPHKEISTMAGTKRKKKVKARQKFGLAAAPIDGSFMEFKLYVHRELDTKEYVEIIKNYIKREYSKDDAKAILANESYEFTYSHIAAMVYWKALGNEFTGMYSHAVDFLKERFGELLESGREIVAARKPKVVSIVKSPAERAREKNIKEIMPVLYAIEDKWNEGDNKATVDLYTEMKIKEIKRLVEIQAWIDEHLYDYEAFVSKSDDQITEAYNHLGMRAIKARIKTLKSFQTAVESIKSSKKATRRVTTTKRRGADKQVEKMKFQKENNEYQLTSINPMRVPGSMNLYVFNTKTRQLTQFVSASRDGLIVSGSTIRGFDKELSRVLKLRKPADVLPVIMKKTPKQIDKFIDQIKANKKTPSGRINDQTIILRVK